MRCLYDNLSDLLFVHLSVGTCVYYKRNILSFLLHIFSIVLSDKSISSLFPLYLTISFSPSSFSSSLYLPADIYFIFIKTGASAAVIFQLKTKHLMRISKHLLSLSNRLRNAPVCGLFIYFFLTTLWSILKTISCRVRCTFIVIFRGGSYVRLYRIAALP